MRKLRSGRRWGIAVWQRGRIRRGELDGLQRPPVSEASKGTGYGDLDGRHVARTLLRLREEE